MLSETTQAAMAGRSERLAEAMRRALIQAIRSALNDWAMEPTETNRKAVTRIMRRYESEVREEVFQVPTKGPFGTQGGASRSAHPDDLGALLEEVRDVLPKLIEVEQQTSESRKAEEREVRWAKKAEKGTARAMLKQENAAEVNGWEDGAKSGKLPWE